MRISENLPQFEDKKTLIIVSSTQAADLYEAYNGEIEKMDEVRTERIDPDKPEGHFERKRAGQTLGGGGVVDDRDKRLKDRFHQDLQEALGEIGTDFDTVILLSSPQDKASTKEQFSAQLAKLLTIEIDGNFVGQHPNEILKRIQASE